MRTKVRFPLMAKVAMWLVVHLLVLAVAFSIFVGWQLQLGLDSLLTGATGERLSSLGKDISAKLDDAPESEWDAVIRTHVAPFGLDGILRRPEEMGPDVKEATVPETIIERVKRERPPSRGGPGGRPGPPGFPPGPGRGPDDFRPGPPPRDREARALFLTRDPEQGNFWAALELHFTKPGPERPRSAVLFLKSETASARGLFFDFRPWLFGGLAVLTLSILLWAPFVLGITRYAGRISKATARIADGNFDTKIGASRNDELGRAGESIEEMSTRLGNLIAGQKRFLADVAHELCAPLARMRTGLGILQNGAEGREAERIGSIDEDAEELSALVSELLAFTKANSSAVEIETITLVELLEDLVSRELEGHPVEMKVPEDITVNADRRFLTRALVNILRNCHRHAGAECVVRISGKSEGDEVGLFIEDNGPGVADGEMSRLFEPFYRPDRSRTRDTGGSGLGMAIVESSVRACGGKVSAEKSELGGLLVKINIQCG